MNSNLCSGRSEPKRVGSMDQTEFSIDGVTPSRLGHVIMHRYRETVGRRAVARSASASTESRGDGLFCIPDPPDGLLQLIFAQEFSVLG